MKTVYFRDPTKENIEAAAKIIRDGGLLAIPTETVYGLGADALNEDAVLRIFLAKGRPQDNPLIIHVPDSSWLERYCENVPPEAYALAEKFWPGPLTMILPRKPIVPLRTTGGLETVGVRCPNHPITRAVIAAADVPIAAPSGNTSGRPSPTCIADMIEDMDGRIEMILDGGEEVGIGLESTIVDLTGDIPMILRPGYVTQKMLEEVANQVDVDKTILDANCHLRPKAPGMRYRHYAPKGDLTIIEGAQDAVKEAICEKSRQATADGHRVGIIATDETMEAYRQNSNAASIKSVGSRLDEAAVGRSLYRILREFDDENLDILFSESFAESGFGQAIMNRLLKAAGHHVEQV